MIDGLYTSKLKGDLLLVRSDTGWYCSSLFTTKSHRDAVQVLLKNKMGWPVDRQKPNISLVAPEELLTW